MLGVTMLEVTMPKVTMLKVTKSAGSAVQGTTSG
jgi:hypothetical protein